MARDLNVHGLGFRVAMFFGRNPEEELTAQDMAVKFAVDVSDVSPMLRRAISNGLVAQLSRGGGRGNPATYGAGPMLLSMVGIVTEACAPARGLQVSAGGQ